MFEKKCVPSKLIIALLIVMLLLGQTCVGSFGADTSANSSTIADKLTITKTIERVNTNYTNNTGYVLGELINVRYKIQCGEIKIKIPKEIVFVIDLTRSMTANAGPVSRIKALKNVLPAFLEQWKDKDTKIGFVTFSSKAKVETELLEANEHNISALKKTIESWSEIYDKNKPDKSLGAGTNLGDGLRLAYHKLKGGDEHARKFIISLTDGEPDVYTYDKNHSETIPPQAEGDLSKVYFGSLPIDGNDLLHSDNNTLDYGRGKNYAAGIMKKISEKNVYTNFLIGFGVSDKATLNFIGGQGSVGHIDPNNPNSDYFYSPTNASDLNNVFNNIHKAITEFVPFSNPYISQPIPSGLTLPDDTFSGIPLSLLVFGREEDKSQIASKSPGNLHIPLDVTLKLKANTIDTYEMVPNNFEFIIQFRVTKTKEITLPPPNAQFIFEDPATRDLQTISLTTKEDKLNGRQNVDSVIIPPMIVFAGSQNQAEAVINPKTGLEDGDDAINNWDEIDATQKIGDLSNSVDSNRDIIDVDDGTGKNTFANITAFAGKYGVQTVVAESLGYAFGGNGHVIGKGRIISIMPEVKPITMKLAETKDASITLSEAQTNYLGDRVKKIMDEYYFNQMNFVDDTSQDNASQDNAFENTEFKLYPKNSDYYLKYGGPLLDNEDFNSVTIGSNISSSLGSNGNWILELSEEESSRSYYIRNGGDNPGYLVSGGTPVVYLPTLDYPPNESLWKIDLMEDGYFRITSKVTGKSLTFDNSSNDFSSELYANSPGQKWKFEKQGTKEPSGVPAKLEDIINKIEFESDDSGNPTAKADEPNAVRIAFGNRGDRTKLKITGIRPTKLDSKPLGDGKITITTNVIYKNISYKNSKSETKATLTFDVIIEDIVDIN